MHRQLTKRQFLLAFFATVFVLAVVKHLVINTHNDVQEKQTELAGLSEQTQGQYVPIAAGTLQNVSGKYHRILSVPNYKVAFPDSQSVQIQAAEQWGVKPVKNREDAEARKRELENFSKIIASEIDKNAPAPAAPVNISVITVQKGDTLSGIAAAARRPG